MVSALLKSNASVDAKTMMGLTPLHKAAEAGRAEAITALLEGGASPDVQARLPFPVIHPNPEPTTVCLLRLYCSLGVQADTCA